MQEIDHPQHIVIAGAGIAGASAVELLRREGYSGRITLVGEEPELPYERPPLSKGYLQGATPEEKVFLRREQDYAEWEVELRLGTRATGLDTTARRLTLASCETLPYDRLLIATGGHALRLPIPGAQLDGIAYLRTLADARALAARVRAVQERGGRIVVAGAGFIGAEVAASCRMLGLDVTVIEPLPQPLVRVLGEQIGAWCAAVHRAHGVTLRLGEGVAAFGGQHHVEEVVTTSGARIPCDLAIVGVGMRPATDWLRGSGVAINDGVLVDQFCQTNALGVYAAGDVARCPYTQAGLPQPEMVRLEHFDNGLRQGEAAARNLLGKQVPYTPVPYFWSDQYDLVLQYVGYAPGWDQLVLRGQPESGSFAAFYLAEGRIRAALGVNRVRELAALKKLIGVAADAAQLADESVNLRTLVSPHP